MLSQQLTKRKRISQNLLIITILVSIFFFPKLLYAQTISPISTEATLAPGQSINQNVKIINEKNYDIYLTPKIYKYYPQSEYVLDIQEYEEFVKITTDYTKIPANSTQNIPFQIVAPESLEPGTYYNLIVFSETEKEQDEKPVIGAIGAISHIVKLNLIENLNSDTATNNYDINLEVLDRGIPFIKDTKLKLTFYNNSNYTLIPKGEIQVVKRSGNKEPEYFKINIDRTRVFPEQKFEEEFNVKNWYLEDIIFGKNVYLKLQNGLDENVKTQEIAIPSFRNELLYILATITIVILLGTSLRGDTKSKPKSSE